jgi:hypothetical protein
MEKIKIEEGNTNYSIKGLNKEERLSDNLSEDGKKLVLLVIKIIVNKTLRECYEEKGDKIS